MFKKEVKDKTYSHTVDSQHGTTKSIPQTVSVTPNSGLIETINKLGDTNRLKCSYNVGKKPETKSIQNTK